MISGKPYNLTLKALIPAQAGDASINSGSTLNSPANFGNSTNITNQNNSALSSVNSNLFGSPSVLGASSVLQQRIMKNNHLVRVLSKDLTLPLSLSLSPFLVFVLRRHVIEKQVSHAVDKHS